MVKQIKLTKGKIAVVDDVDFERFNKYKWRVSQNGKCYYAVRYAMIDDKEKGVRMHREIMNPPKDMQVDHINGDGLDNRRCNLRLASRSQNLSNMRMRNHSSEYKGVHWYERDKMWQVQIMKERKRFYLGRFVDEKEAGLVYNRKAKELFGEYAKLNNIPIN